MTKKTHHNQAENSSDVSRQYSSSDPVKPSTAAAAAAAAAVDDNQMTIYWLMSSVWWSNVSSNMLFMSLWLLPRLTQPSNEVKEVRRQQKWSLQRLCHAFTLHFLSSSSSISCLMFIKFLLSFNLFCCIFHSCPLNHACLVLTDTNSSCSSFFSRISCSGFMALTPACCIPAASQITIFTTIWGCSGFCALCPGSLSSLVT